ncbi:hypothetical protein VTP01DRAFT_955 [Rhizomucor pusillus]|uniref:uncharacterized protein n=1 Tax=Rhizomucor pusillus TaxID=4840 RepID=UPI0037442BEA
MHLQQSRCIAFSLTVAYVIHCPILRPGSFSPTMPNVESNKGLTKSTRRKFFILNDSVFIENLSFGGLSSVCI